MLLAKVTGTVVATRKNETLTGSKLLVVHPLASGGPEGTLVAVDRLGAGIGDLVLVALGSAARLAAGERACIDAAVVGIVDSLEK
jgi:ethanolamine utilization protein EutN